MSLHYIAKPLTYIYNLAISQNIIPGCFKQAKVIPIPKCSDTSVLDNFRPISVLPILSKPLERHMHSHLYQYFEQNNLLHNFQSGFRSKHSSQTAVTHLCNTWLQAINNENLVGALFLDLRKAFDLVDHQILLKKLHLYTLSDQCLHLFTSYLCERQQSVLVNGIYSSYNNVKCGVPQGSILGPVLFCLYINDLPLCLTTNKATIELFADDSTLHTQGKTLHDIQCTLQVSVNEIQQWCYNNKMVLHPKKSKCMIVTTRQKHQRQPLDLQLAINSTKIEQVHSHKVLGIIIDDTFSWRSHVDYICCKISRNLFLMKKMSFFVTVDVIKQFFYAHCLSHINYISTVWCNASNIVLKKLDMLHRRGIKILLPDSSIETVKKYQLLNILTLKNQFIFNLGVLMYKITNNVAPVYLSNLFCAPAFQGRYYLFNLPLPRIDLFKSSLIFWGAKEWNSFPDVCKVSSSLRAFKSNLYKHLNTSE